VDWRPGTANFLVDPARQIVAEEFDAGGYDEIRDDALVALLRTLAAQLAPMHPITPTAPADILRAPRRHQLVRPLVGHIENRADVT